jgi:glycosyltransferase involved in cell wall biosynthesis
VRILFICNEYPPYLHGGIGSFTRDIANGLVNTGVSVTIWGLYDNLENDVFETINGVNVHRIKRIFKGGRFDQLKMIWDLNNKLYKFLKTNKFDIIEIQEWQGLIPFGIKHPGYVVRLHGASIFFDKLLKRNGNRLTHILEKYTIKNAKHIVSVSNYCGLETMKLVALNKPFTTIYNGVDSNKIYPNLEIEAVSGRIVFANSMLPKKGIFELAKAFNLIKENQPHATLIYIGKTGYSNNGINVKELVFSLIKPEYRNDVKILGWLNSAKEVYDYLNSAEVCVYPSHMEGFGIAPVEGMMLGKPVVFMKDGPGPELINDGETGYLADTLDFKSIANYVILALSNKADSAKIGKNASISSKLLFDLNNVIIPENINYYNKIINK